MIIYNQIRGTDDQEEIRDKDLGSGHGIFQYYI
jgi:hypothetical protein